MNKKLDFNCLQNLAASRNPFLHEVTDIVYIRIGNLKLFCNTCEQFFEVPAASYLNAKKTGCTSCKSINNSIATKLRCAANKLLPDSFIAIRKKEQKSAAPQKRICLY